LWEEQRSGQVPGKKLPDGRDHTKAFQRRPPQDFDRLTSKAVPKEAASFREAPPGK